MLSSFELQLTIEGGFNVPPAPDILQLSFDWLPPQFFLLQIGHHLYLFAILIFAFDELMKTAYVGAPSGGT